MFDSKISAKSLIADLKSEVDIAYPISNSTYIGWLNSLEQQLYSEIIKEQRQYVPNAIHLIEGEAAENDEAFNIKRINEREWSAPFTFQTAEDEDSVRFEDIYTVYINGIQLIKTNLTSIGAFPFSYCKDGSLLRFSCLEKPDLSVRIVYFARPALKNVNEQDEILSGNVMLPAEFIELVKAKLRAEAYKMANENILAGNWINDYNVLLEYFKQWVTGKNAQFGQ